MLWSPRLSLSNFHVKLTAKGLFRNLQLLSGCRKNTVVFHAGLDPAGQPSNHHPTIIQPPSNHHPTIVQSSNHCPVSHPFLVVLFSVAVWKRD
uniref:Uncharacterized protein n=1 Tax=Xiphophorus couchianus TaxID=32473 RepID=A0A3B5LR71_9TELE